jgi:hypothetical protein
MGRNRQAGIGFGIACFMLLGGCVYNGRPVLAMDEYAQSVGIEVARTEVESCIEEATLVRDRNVRLQNVLCAMFISSALATDSNIDPHCFALNETELFQVAVDRCLEEKGFDVLVWRG